MFLVAIKKIVVQMEANCLNMIFFGLLFCICGVHERDVRVSGEEAF